MTAELHQAYFEISNRVALLNPSGRTESQIWLEIDATFAFTRPCRDYGDYRGRVEQAFQKHILATLETKRMRELVRENDLKGLATWIKKSIEKKIPQALLLKQISLQSEKIPPQSVTISYGNQETPSLVNKASNSDVIDPIRGLLMQIHSCGMKSKIGVEENYLSRSSLKMLGDLLRCALEHTVPVSAATFICPPYVKAKYDEGHNSYVSVHHDFFADPRTYNFDYDYQTPIKVLSSFQKLCSDHGIEVSPTIVLGDWGLICIDAIRKTLGSDQTIIENLNRFRSSMDRYLQINGYQDISTTSFRQLGAPDLMPIGLPFDAEDRLQWLRDYSRSDSDSLSRNAKNQKKYLGQLLNLSEDESVMERLLEWRSYDSLYVQLEQRIGSDETVIPKNLFVQIAKVFSNVHVLRVAEGRPLESLNHQTSPRFSFIDTLLRWTQYQVYSELFTKQKGDAACLYFDEKFSSCGHFFSTDKMSVVLLDAQAIQDIPEKQNAVSVPSRQCGRRSSTADLTLGGGL